MLKNIYILINITVVQLNISVENSDAFFLRFFFFFFFSIFRILLNRKLYITL